MNLIKLVRRRSVAIVIDAFIVINAYLLASLILFANGAPRSHYQELVVFLALAAVTHCCLNFKFGLYRFVGRYVGFNQAWKVVQASALGITVLLVITVFVKPSSTFHAAMMIPIGGILVMVIIGGVRFYPRVFYERNMSGIDLSHANIMVVGAGDSGERLVSNIHKDRNAPMKVVAVIDDDTNLAGKDMHGVPIYAPLEGIRRITEKKGVDEIYISIPSATIEQFQRIWRMCTETGLPVKTIGSLQGTNYSDIDISNIRDIRIEDFLGRQPVKTDYQQISELLLGKTVVVTGAGGSIGSELVLQISEHRPGRIILIDQDETALYNLHERMKHMLIDNYDMFVADVKSKRKMEIIFEDTRPDIVFHAAAYKHVPLMEVHPDEGVLNNVEGTLNVAWVAGDYGVSSFVNISTDKAVEPINVLGATKRLGERLVAEMDSYYPETNYCSVRFGNVLGSRGSVIPIFREQILKGGPVTITDPEMTRYFMTITEAVDLVLQAASFREGNVIYVLDMGKPEKILDLANQMIAFMQPDKYIEIIFTGIRPGEKLHEYLYEAGEEADDSTHPKIFSVDPFSWDDETILGRLSMLFDAARSNDHEEICNFLKEWIPTYRPFEMSKTGMIAGRPVNEDTDLLTSRTAEGPGMTYSTENENPSVQFEQLSDSGCYNYKWNNKANGGQIKKSYFSKKDSHQD